MNHKFELPDVMMNVEYVAELQYVELSGQCESWPHSHSCCELVYVESGNIKVESASYCGGLDSGKAIIIRPNETHCVMSADETMANVVIVGFECDSPELESLSLRPVYLSTAQTKILADIVKEAKSIYETSYSLSGERMVKRRDCCPFGAEQLLKINLERLLILLVRDSKAEPVSGRKYDEDNIKKVYEYIAENFTGKITLDNLCFLFGINKTTLCQNFKREFGITVLEYINSLRIKEAQKLLGQTSFSITEISERVGFESIHYFCRFFKKHVGVSPKVYARIEKQSQKTGKKIKESAKKSY